MTFDWVAQHEVRFGGAEGALTFRLGAGPTGEPVSREARLQCGPLDGLISGFFDLDAPAILKRLRELLGRADMTGSVYLTESEHGEFLANLSLDHGRGEITVTFASEFGGQHGGGMLTLSTDQTHVTEAVRQIEHLLRT